MISIDDIKIYPEEIEGPNKTPVYPFSVMIDGEEWFGKLRFNRDPKRYEDFNHYGIVNHYDLDYDTRYHGLVYSQKLLALDAARLDGKDKIRIKDQTIIVLINYLRTKLDDYIHSKKATREI